MFARLTRELEDGVVVEAPDFGVRHRGIQSHTRASDPGFGFPSGQALTSLHFATRDASRIDINA